MTTTHYVLDPAAGLTQLLADGTNTYLYGNDRLAQYQAAMQYFGADGLGSVRQLFDASAQVVGSSRYDPFGNVMSQGGTATSVFAFAGEQHDAATGLEYLRARYYSAAQGRFTTRDVWEGDYERPLSLNRWNYVQANAVNHTDPSGFDLFIVGGAGWTGADPYDDPSYWEPWISAYTSWTHREFVDKWYNRWTAKGADDSQKAEIARETGIAVFKWSAVPGGAQAFGNTAEGARNIQKQVDELNLRDVTILGHSKGAAAGATLIGLYQNGEAKGAVKSMVLIDPPQGDAWDWIWGSNTSVDALEAGVKVAVLHGAVQCGVCECKSGIKNAIDIPYEPTHDIRTDWALWVFEHMGLESDAHYRKP